jgi:hypothetical protein
MSDRDRTPDGRFAKGNPGGDGRRLGSRNKLTQWEAELREKEGPIIKAIVKCALKGDGVAQ